MDTKVCSKCGVELEKQQKVSNYGRMAGENMKVGDLVRYKNQRNARGEVYLIVRTEAASPCGQRLKVWIYPDAIGGYEHTDEHNYYYDHFFEVVSESR